MTDFVQQLKDAAAASRALAAASRDCPHGKIKQVCDRCAAEKTIADLKAKLRAASDALRAPPAPR